MRVITRNGTELGNQGRCVALLACMAENGQLEGFECDRVWFVDEELHNEDDDDNDDNNAISNIEDYDLTESPLRENSRRKPQSLLNRMIRRVFHRRNQHRNASEGAAKEDDYCSDTSTIATSTLSVGSKSSLEGFVITASNKIENDDSSRKISDSTYTLSRIASENKESKNLCGTSEFDIMKAHDLVFDDATASTQQSEASSLSSHFTGGLSLMEQRLLETGLVSRNDFDFVADFVSKEVIHLADKKREDGYDPAKNEIFHVKTGIWEVTRLEDDGTPKSPYFIVTGVSMNDKVDTKKLRKILFGGQLHKRRPKLGMAPTERAEELSGYKAGTMAPICHTEKMKLYLEESLIRDVDTAKHRLNVGSGRFGKCLSISVQDFLEIAKANPKGLEICPIIRQAKDR